MHRDDGLGAGVSRRIVSDVRFWLMGSTSATTGVAPRMTTLLAEAMKVRLGTTTSSPLPMPSA
jgi:hypothetical protein